MSENPTTNGHDHAGNQPKPYDYGGNPLAREDTSASARLPAFGGELQPGLFKPIKDRKIANPAPLGLSAFALTTFVLSLVNVGARGAKLPNIVVGSAYGYGGLVQLLAGMWEMAVGNTFGATALSSYGGFWISFAITLTSGGFGVTDAYGGVESPDFANAFGFYLFGWFIFTFLMLLCTFRSTVAFFILFLTLDMAFLCLGIAYVDHTVEMGEGGAMVAATNHTAQLAGGYFGLLAAFAAWYNALAGILDRGNSFFLIPVAHFPWSEKGRERRGLPKMADKEDKVA